VLSAEVTGLIQQSPIPFPSFFDRIMIPLSVLFEIATAWPSGITTSVRSLVRARRSAGTFCSIFSLSLCVARFIYLA